MTRSVLTPLVARLLAALAIAGICLVLPASPAAACSCVGIDRVLRDDPEVAFVGVLKRQKADDSKTINRFAVEEVFRGAVHRTQDVVSPVRDTCGVEWTFGDRALVLGSRDDAGRIATNLCSYVVEGAEEYDAAVATLGEGTEPLVGSEVVERDGLFRRDHLWVRLVVGVVGLVVLGVMAARWLRGRRA